MTIENLSIIIMAGAVVAIAAVLFAWFKVIDRMALWIIRVVSKKIPNWFKSLF